MLIKFTKRERATVLAALRRWVSYPAAREADPIATNGRKHKPLDNAEIDRLCRRITRLDTKREAAHALGQASNGTRAKGLRLRDGVRTVQIRDHLKLVDRSDTGNYFTAARKASDSFCNFSLIFCASALLTSIDLPLAAVAAINFPSVK